MTCSRRRIAALSLLLVLSLLAGCQGQKEWNLGVHNLSVDGNNGEPYEVTGEVDLGGFFGEVTVTGVQLRHVSEDGQVIAETDIGTLHGDAGPSTIAFNESVQTLPQCVFIRYNSIDAPDNHVSTINAYTLTDDGYWGFDRPIDDSFESCQVVMEEAEEIG